VTFSGGVGARIGLTDRMGAVVDGRLHEIGTSGRGTTAELTVGLRWTLGPR
jgi:hypothetical protein